MYFVSTYGHTGEGSSPLSYNGRTESRGKTEESPGELFPMTESTLNEKTKRNINIWIQR